jgi:predicted TPR repeat methyltransferase
MADNWDDYAKTWEHSDTIRFSEQVFSILQSLVDLQGQRVLDFGCGTGLLSHKMSPLAKDIVALDSSEAMIEELDKKQLVNVEPVVDILSRGLIAQHPAFRGQFDCIVASSVCGFLGDYPKAVTLIYSLLDDQGTFIHWDWLDETGEQMTEKNIEKTLRSAGFSGVFVSIPFSFETQQGAKKVVMGVGKK